MNTISSIKEQDCMGCFACSAICPERAIQMRESKKGFLTAWVDTQRCCGCGLCRTVCPVLGLSPSKQAGGSVYAVRHKENAVRKDSTSGGMFSALAEQIQNRGGVIYGAASQGNDVFHIRIADENWQMLRGSKYVQSDLRNTFGEVYKDLQGKREVLFVGTPCQCDGLRNYLKTRKCSCETLILVDFICHGTASRRLYRDYIRYCEQKSEKKIVAQVFRSKCGGWHNHVEENVFGDGSRDHESFHSQLFAALFNTAYIFKPACYQCPYASKERCADLTLGDFWGIEKSCPEMDDNQGVSFVMLNTDKAVALFNEVQHRVIWRAMRIEDTNNPHLHVPTPYPKAADLFWEYYRKKGFRKTIVKYCAAGKIRRFLSRIYHGFLKAKNTP